MKSIELIRIEKSSDGVFGFLRIDGKVFCSTLEPEDKNNQRMISCIPEGQYICVRYHSPKFLDTFEITGVPNRSKILFHKGNTELDSMGCVLLGENYGAINGKLGIINSTSAFKRFMEYMKDERSFEINIFYV